MIKNIKFIFIIFNFFNLYLNSFFYLNANDFIDLSFVDLFLTLFFIFGFFVFKILINGKEVDWFSIDTIFVVMFSLFHYSYLILYSLGWVDYNNEVFWNSNIFYQSLYFSNMCMIGFVLGFSLFGYQTRIHKINLNFDYRYSLNTLSKFLFIIVFLMFWLPIISIFNLAVNDYKVLISVGEISPIGKLYWVGQYLAVCALSLYYATKDYNKKFLHSFFDYLVLFYIFGYLVIGDRGGFILYMIIPLIIYNDCYKKINILKSLFFTITLLSISAVIAVARNYSVYNPLEAILLYNDSKELNPVISALAEFGASFKTLTLIMSYIPNHYDYWYGKSYIDSFLLTFPNFGEARKSTSVATWLTETAFGKDSYGRGGSIAMESFANFGVIGSVLFFCSLGVISAKLYKIYKNSKKLIHIVMYLSFISILCLWMRNTSVMLFRTIIWSVLITYFFIALIPYLPIRKVK